MKEKTISMKVFRYDSEVDEKPRYVSYSVPLQPKMTVLDALMYIRENCDSSLAFRYSCRYYLKCGLCAMLINGKPGFACYEKAKDGMTLAPLPMFPVVKDLVIDQGKADRRNIRIRAFFERMEPPSEEPERVYLKDYEAFKDLRRCMDCLACLAVCPIVEHAWDEFAGPVAMGKLARFALDPRDEGDKVRTAFLEGLYDCSTCGKCVEVCPWEIDLRRVIERIRALAVERGTGPRPGHKEFVDCMKKTGYSIEVKNTPFIEQIPDVIEVEKPIDEVFFYSGCLINLRLQDVGMNLVEVLKRNRVRVRIPKGFVCCGSVAFRSGVQEVTRQLVTKNVDYFEELGVEKLVGLCPGCMSTIKQDWSVVLNELNRAPYLFKAFDINEYLVDELGIDRVNIDDLHPINLTITYHDPCHLNRHQGILKEPRELLSLIPGIKFVESRESDRCCGAGGGVRAGRRPLSYIIANRKLSLLAETGADAFVTSCSFCTVQLKDAVTRLGYKQDVYNVTDLLAKSYRGETT